MFKDFSWVPKGGCGGWTADRVDVGGTNTDWPLERFGDCKNCDKNIKGR